MAKSSGLRRVVDEVAPFVRSATHHTEIVANAFATPLAIAAQSLSHDHVVVVVPTASEVPDLVDAVAALLGDDRLVAGWPAWDTHPLERVSPDLSVMGERNALRWRLHTSDEPYVLVSSVRALSQILVPGSPRAPMTIAAGDQLDRDDFVRALVEQGYRRESIVEHRGEVAVRGGIVDLWPTSQDEPLRVDLFGDEIERLTVFDIADQRSLRPLASASIFAAREWLLSDAMKERAREMATRWPSARVLDQLANGQLVDGMEGWLPWFASEPRCLLDELPTASLMVVEPSRVRERLEDLLDEERELTAAVAATWGISDEPRLLHRDYEEAVGDAPTVLSVVGVSSSEMSSAWNISSPPVVQGDPARLAAHVKSWSPSGRGVVVASSTTSAQRMAELLRAEGLDVTTDPDAVLDVRLSVIVSTLPTGFALESPELVVWSEADITGRRSAHRVARARARTVDGFFDDLAAGSYVVHRQHGVARFSGSTTREINGTTRDYLILEFRDGRSYWPTDQIDALTPYTGGDSPSLSRMGGVEWQKTSAKARAAAFLVAQELVELYRSRSVAKGFAFSPDTAWQREMESLFPYNETADQLRAIADVKADMESPRPMDRLVCADVGFGKTEIALRAIFKAVQDNKQVALLVPTTLLASQHLATMKERFAGFPINVAMLSRFVDDREVTATLQGLAEGTVDVVVGTHRLLSPGVNFKDLGLLVVDEEQRFGVTHKEAIKQRSVGVDVLTLSASPIPRTLEMAFTGIRDLSMVTTPPAERRPILTHVGEYADAAVVEALRRELLREGQVFYVHNRVSDIDQVATRLGRLVPDARIAVAHGQMDEGTLEQVVVDFWERKFDVLVCTTIIESGIDMPSVNTLIVDRAERLGLGQLHQLRGRVGRGGARAYAYLFYAPDHVPSETAYERLRTIGDNTALGSGFKIAMRDLEIRGAGNLLGHDQSGPVAAVGYDLYVQLVAEAVADAKGETPVSVPTVNLDVPGEAHLPTTYVEADDARLEAYRRLATITTRDELDDLRAEWLDRYGPLPTPAEGLLALSELRVECLRTGITDVTVKLAAVGVRSKPVARLSPLALPLSTQLRLRRLYGPRSYDETTKEVRVEFPNGAQFPQVLTELVRDVA